MTDVLHAFCHAATPPRETAADLVARYASESLARTYPPDTADRYRALLDDVLALTGEAGLLTADPALAAAAFRSTGRPQDRYKAGRVGGILDEFRAWVAGH